MAYTPSELRRMILAGAAQRGVNNAHAVAHILIFLELADQPGFLTKHLQITGKGDAKQAWVKDWDALIDEDRGGGGQHRMLELAKGLDRGTPIDIRDLTTGYGSVFARVAAEAILIATGYGAWYRLHPTKVKQDHDEWSAKMFDVPTPAPATRADLLTELELVTSRMNQINAELSGKVPE